MHVSVEKFFDSVDSTWLCVTVVNVNEIIDISLSPGIKRRFCCQESFTVGNEPQNMLFVLPCKNVNDQNLAGTFQIHALDSAGVLMRLLIPALSTLDIGKRQRRDCRNLFLVK
jgi:hypothetical protein